MTVSRQIEQAVKNLGSDKVFTIADLAFPSDWWENVRIKLSRMVQKGVIVKVAAGKYYKPRVSILGPVPPSTESLVKDILYKDGETKGYLTGLSVWDSLGLTTQFSSTIVIGLNHRKDAITRNGRKIRFIIQPNPINSEDIYLMQILDALKFIKSIPDTTVSKSTQRLRSIIQELPAAKVERLAKLAVKYPPRVRALTGALIENLGFNEQADRLKATLNFLSEYKLGITDSILPNLSNWKIV